MSSRSMRRRGYTHLGYGKCKGCNEDIEWWESAKGKKLPFGLDGSPHWLRCASPPPRKGIVRAKRYMELKDDAP